MNLLTLSPLSLKLLGGSGSLCACAGRVDANKHREICARVLLLHVVASEHEIIILVPEELFLFNIFPSFSLRHS